MPPKSEAVVSGVFIKLVPGQYNESGTKIHVGWEMALLDSGAVSLAYFSIELSTSIEFSRAHTHTYNVSYQPNLLYKEIESPISPSMSVVWARVRSTEITLSVSDWAISATAWKVAKDCDDDHFLNNTLLDLEDWHCTPCPVGASCVGAVVSEEVGPKFGWARCPSEKSTKNVYGDKDRVFEKCSYPASCLGRANPALKGKFEFNGEEGGVLLVDNNSSVAGRGNTFDPAEADFAQGCTLGYRNDSLLCSGCESGFSLGGGNGQCNRCPDKSQNTFIIFAAVVGGVLGMVILVRLTLESAGDSLDASDGVKMIICSYLQMLGLLAGFPIEWPRFFKELFRVGGAVTALGQHFVNLKCASETSTEADVFFLTKTFWATLPVILVSGCVGTWYAVRMVVSVSHFKRKLLASCVALLYVVYPSLCTQTFSLFACRQACGSMLLRADLSEPCWRGRHASYVVGLGLPMALAYVIGLPLATWVTVRRKRASRAAKTQGLSMREKMHRLVDDNFVFGTFYSSYREEIWWWEMIVTIRKVSVACLAVFGGAMQEMQVHLSSALVMGLLLLQTQMNPYLEDRKILQTLEILSLVTTWLTLWTGTIFYSYPKCEGSAYQQLAWCNGISVLIGMFNVIILFVMLVFFLRFKRESRKQDAQKSKSKTKIAVAPTLEAPSRSDYVNGLRTWTAVGEVSAGAGGAEKTSSPLPTERQTPSELAPSK
jgi:hypothetical protein